MPLHYLPFQVNRLQVNDPTDKCCLQVIVSTGVFRNSCEYVFSLVSLQNEECLYRWMLWSSKTRLVSSAAKTIALADTSILSKPLGLLTDEATLKFGFSVTVDDTVASWPAGTR